MRVLRTRGSHLRIYPATNSRPSTSKIDGRRVHYLDEGRADAVQPVEPTFSKGAGPFTGVRTPPLPVRYCSRMLMGIAVFVLGQARAIVVAVSARKALRYRRVISFGRPWLPSPSKAPLSGRAISSCTIGMAGTFTP